jgi:hypothetical protein
MYRIKDGLDYFKTAYECAVSFFKSEAVVALPFGTWMHASTGETVIIVKEKA